MANDLNRCEFIGRLGQDPEIKYLNNGTAVAKMSLAVGKAWKNKSTGERQTRTEWIPVTAWRRLAEIMAEYLKKGSQIWVCGEWKTDIWEGNDGKKNYSVHLEASQMQMLGGGGKPNQREDREPVNEDDIPF